MPPLTRLRRIAVLLAVLTSGLLPLGSNSLAQDLDLPLPRPRPVMTEVPPDEVAPVPADLSRRPRPGTPAQASALADPNSLATPATEAIDAVTATPQPVQLAVQVTEDGGPITTGVVWRIFDTQADADGQLAMVAKSESPLADLSLPPGDYVVHVAYGRAQASDSLTVTTGANSKTIVLDAGGMRLNAMVAGDVPIPPDLIRFDIYSSDAGADPNMPVAQDVLSNTTLTLNSGSYHVVSRFGSVNAVVRVDLRVEPGQLTDAVLYHKAGQVAFRLVSEAGGEAIADVDWTVKAADGTTVFSEIGAFPTTVLAEGQYLILAKRGDTVYNREFEVTAGQPQEIEVLTSVY